MLVVNFCISYFPVFVIFILILLNQVKVATRSSEKNIVKFDYHMIDSFNLGIIKTVVHIAIKNER